MMQFKFKGVIGSCSKAVWFARQLQALAGLAHWVLQRYVWFTSAFSQAHGRFRLVGPTSAQPIHFFLSQCTISNVHPLCSHEPGWPDTLISLVSAEPGQQTIFAPREPGPKARLGNQSSAACIWRAWFGWNQATNQAHSLLWGGSGWLYAYVRTAPPI